MKVDVKHNTSHESTHHFRNNQHTTRNIQIEAIDHTDIGTNRQEKCRKSPTDHGKTLDQHTIHHNAPSASTTSQHHIPNKMKKSTKFKYKGDAQHNTTQHNPQLIPPAQIPPPKNQLYSSDPTIPTTPKPYYR